MTAHTSLSFLCSQLCSDIKQSPLRQNKHADEERLAGHRRCQLHTHTHTQPTINVRVEVLLQADDCQGSNIFKKLYEPSLKQSRESNKNKGIHQRLRPETHLQSPRLLLLIWMRVNLYDKLSRAQSNMDLPEVSLILVREETQHIIHQVKTWT